MSSLGELYEKYEKLQKGTVRARDNLAQRLIKEGPVSVGSTVVDRKGRRAVVTAIYPDIHHGDPAPDSRTSCYRIAGRRILKSGEPSKVSARLYNWDGWQLEEST